MTPSIVMARPRIKSAGDPAICHGTRHGAGECQ